MLTLVYLALAIYGLVRLLRAWGPIQQLVVRGVKPWACDVCLSFWIAGVLGLQVLIMHHHLRPAAVEATLIAMAIPGLVQLLLAWTAAQVPQEGAPVEDEATPVPRPPVSLNALLRSGQPKEIDFRDPDLAVVRDTASGTCIATFTVPEDNTPPAELACIQRARAAAGPEHHACAFAINKINVKGGRVYDNTCRKWILDEIPDMASPVISSTSGT